MGRIVWLLVIERDESGNGLRGWVKWAVFGLSVLGFTGFLIYRWISKGGIL